MLNRYLLIVLALTLLVTSGAVIGCGKVGVPEKYVNQDSVPGKYVNQDNPCEYLELNEDGTFYVKQRDSAFDGEWEVKGSELRLHLPMLQVATAKIREDTIYDEHGNVWVKLKDRDAKPVGNPFHEMLKMVPDSPDNRLSVYLNDYARIREVYDIPLPLPEADITTIEAYVRSMVNVKLIAPGQPYVSGIHHYALKGPFLTQFVGFGPQDMDWGILVSRPPRNLEAVGGRFDLWAIECAFSKYSEDEKPDSIIYDDFIIYDWGDGDKINLPKRLAPPAYDNLGRRKALGIHQDYILRAVDGDSIKEMINASRSYLASLADNPDFSLMAEVLAEMDTYSASLSGRAITLPLLMDAYPESQSALNTVSETEPLLGDYRAFATGVGKDEKGHFMVVVIVYTESYQAASDVSIFRQRIENGLNPYSEQPWQKHITDFDVWADGRSLLAMLRGPIISTAFKISPFLMLRQE